MFRRKGKGNYFARNIQTKYLKMLAKCYDKFLERKSFMVNFQFKKLEFNDWIIVSFALNYKV